MPGAFGMYSRLCAVWPEKTKERARVLHPTSGFKIPVLVVYLLI